VNPLAILTLQAYVGIVNDNIGNSYLLKFKGFGYLIKEKYTSLSI